jgi:hypothetical protein
MTATSRLTPEKQREQTAREQRLAQALRDNLRRRKEQARSRDNPPDAAEPPNVPPVEPDRSLP